MINLFIKKIFYQYSVNDIENFIFNILSRQPNINKHKLFNLINNENNQPSEKIINLTHHYNLFNNILRCAIISLILLFIFMGINNILIGIGFVYFFILLIYQRYIDEQFYLINTYFKQKII